MKTNRTAILSICLLSLTGCPGPAEDIKYANADCACNVKGAPGNISVYFKKHPGAIYGINETYNFSTGSCGTTCLVNETPISATKLSIRVSAWSMPGSMWRAYGNRTALPQRDQLSVLSKVEGEKSTEKCWTICDSASEEDCPTAPSDEALYGKLSSLLDRIKEEQRMAQGTKSGDGVIPAGEIQRIFGLQSDPCQRADLHVVGNRLSNSGPTACVLLQIKPGPNLGGRLAGLSGELTIDRSLLAATYSGAGDQVLFDSPGARPYLRLDGLYHEDFGGDVLGVRRVTTGRTMLQVASANGCFQTFKKQ
jgi:hypothetical protein